MTRLLLLGALLAGATLPALAQTPGQYAPAMDCKGWVNADADFKWNQLDGKVILLERWSTT